MCALMKPGAKCSAPGAEFSHRGFMSAHMQVLKFAATAPHPQTPAQGSGGVGLSAS
jgi:hypothetical protein